MRISHPFALVGLLVLAACSSPSPDPAPPVAPEPAKPAPEISKPIEEPPAPAHQAAINAGALTPTARIKLLSSSVVFARLDEVEAFRQLAADSAAANPDCQVISMVEVASTSTSDDLRFWVECSDTNGDPVRYNFSEVDLTPEADQSE